MHLMNSLLILYYSILYCVMLYYITLCYIVLFYIILAPQGRRQSHGPPVAEAGQRALGPRR